MSHDSSAAPEPPKDVDIWFLNGQSLCNFDCSYCVSAGARTDKDMWVNDEARVAFFQVLEWISRQPHRIGLRLTTAGEPFVSREYLNGVAKLTRSENIRFVELLSNASLLEKRLPWLLNEAGADVGKLSLWLTWHHTEIGLDAFLDNATVARDAGVFVCLNGLAFPDNIEQLRELAKRSKERNLRCNLELGQNFNDAYPKSLFLPVVNNRHGELQDLDSLGLSPRLVAVMVTALANPTGLRCTAGHNYFFIDPVGRVFPCKGYGNAGMGELGSALDPDFVLRAQSGTSACALDLGCNCKEDYLHLEAAGRDPEEAPSLGYYGNATTSSVPDVLLERVSRLPRYGALQALLGNTEEK